LHIDHAHPDSRARDPRESVNPRVTPPQGPPQAIAIHLSLRPS
jgi:hypothetical protein